MIDAAQAVRQAVAALAAQRHGTIAYVERYDYREHGPAHDRRVEKLSLLVRVNGKLVAVRAQGGKQAETRDEAEPYVLPLDPETLPEYRFAPAACDGCAQGTLAVAFTSLQRDADHADGAMIVDTKASRIERLSFHPAVLPHGADSGTIDMRFGQVLPDLWDVVTVEEHYTGHVLFMHGWAEIHRADASYRRFASAADALSAASGSAVAGSVGRWSVAIERPRIGDRLVRARPENDVDLAARRQLLLAGDDGLEVRVLVAADP
jgi:hypothetical protein